ncbi:3-hydroxybutyryl-CoA dehydrogenase [Saccharothrix sp. Mg75]|uniref:3-hydroxybutyryl-CoA dehydrogenase n=1 Tax=Saccharothrix sp. Mg75 TaxID=3445357 RepID=UPI003EE9B23C
MTGEVRRVGVVGCGTMGAGIAGLCAESGLEVVVVVTNPASAARGRKRVEAGLDRRVAKGQLDAGDAAAVAARIDVGHDYAALADCHFVVEAVQESEIEKLAVLKQVSAAVGSTDAVVASTTSSIPIVRLARGLEHPERFIGVHFFNPVPSMPLVELTACLLTDDRTRLRTESFVTDVLRKRVIWSRDRAGFVVNALLVPYLLAAVRMVESGAADAETVDAGMELGCAHPMGPLRLIDLIGLDVVAAVGCALYDEFKEPLYAPPPLLSRMVDAGRLGRKAGHGFYRYG